LLTSRTVSKVSGTKDDNMFFNGFSLVTRASTSMSSCTLRYQSAKTRQSICSKLSAIQRCQYVANAMQNKNTIEIDLSHMSFCV